MALEISYGPDAAVKNIGLGLAKEWNSGLKYFKEPKDETSARSFVSQ